MSRRFLQSSALILLAFAGQIFLSGRLQAQNRAATTSVVRPEADGRQIFESICAACHGLDGRGGERGPDIARRRDLQRLPDDALRRIVRQGKPGGGMPPFASLGGPQIESVVRHLRVLQGQGKATMPPGDPARGKTLFFGQAGCSQCHIVSGQGGFLASDLSGYADTRPVAEIRIAITDPNRNLDSRKRTVVVITSDGSTHTGMARNEDNFSLQLQTADGAFHFFDKSDLKDIEYQPVSLMPADYASRLSSKEIDDLVSYLMKAGTISRIGHDEGTFSHSSDACHF